MIGCFLRCAAYVPFDPDEVAFTFASEMSGCSLVSVVDAVHLTLVSGKIGSSLRTAL